VDVLARIFRGNITRWDHSSIVALNPLLADSLPSSGITVVMGSSSKTEAWDVLQQAFCQWDYASWQAEVGGCDSPYTDYAPVASRYSELLLVDTVGAAAATVLATMSSIGFSTQPQIAISVLNSVDMVHAHRNSIALDGSPVR